MTAITRRGGDRPSRSGGSERERLDPELLERLLADDRRDRLAHPIGELLGILVGREPQLDGDEGLGRPSSVARAGERGRARARSFRRHRGDRGEEQVAERVDVLAEHLEDLLVRDRRDVVDADVVVGDERDVAEAELELPRERSPPGTASSRSRRAPSCAYILDSALVENLGPSITTIVPPSRCSIPCDAAVFTSVSRSVGQYGSANETCVVCGPS